MEVLGGNEEAGTLPTSRRPYMLFPARSARAPLILQSAQCALAQQLPPP